MTTSRRRLRTHAMPALLTFTWLVALGFGIADCYDVSVSVPVPVAHTAVLDEGVSGRLYLSRRMMVKRWADARGTFGSAS